MDLNTPDNPAKSTTDSHEKREGAVPLAYRSGLDETTGPTAEDVFCALAACLLAIALLSAGLALAVVSLWLLLGIVDALGVLFGFPWFAWVGTAMAATVCLLGAYVFFRWAITCVRGRRGP